MTTIEVQGQYVVHAGDELSFADETAFQFVSSGTDNPSRLVNAGSISASFTASGTGVVGTSDQGPAVFWNKAGAVLSVSGGATTADGTNGFMLGAPGSLARNEGLISVTSETTAAGGWLIGSRMVNDGDIQVHGGSGRSFGLITGNAAVANHATIQVAGETGVGLFLVGYTKVANSGNIVVSGSMEAVAMAALGDGSDIKNSGLIEATATDPGGMSVAISYSGGSDHDHVVNSGVIRADRAIFVALPFALQIDNSGQIFGQVLLGDGEDVVRNSSLIVGDVDLGQGYDRYLGQHSGSDVVVYGAGHADSLYGGAGDDLLYGDRTTADSFDGDDLLKGGRGHDSLHGGGGADTLIGGAGGDELTGDAGSDVFLFGKISDSVWSAPDLITDLETSDVVDLSAIDADRSQAGDQAFHLVATLGGQAGEAALSYDAAAGLTRLELDVNGDGHADAVVALSGDQTGFANFVL